MYIITWNRILNSNHGAAIYNGIMLNEYHHHHHHHHHVCAEAIINTVIIDIHAGYAYHHQLN